MTKEIPILFSTPMVQAILAGRKTMTRRVVKSEHVLYQLDVNKFVPSYYHNNDEGWCPYGKPGDLLWVRETWTKACVWDGDGEMPPLKYWYRADKDWTKIDWHDKEKDGPVSSPKWKPSIHMPKAAARIWLEVIDIRVERLHEISEGDAEAEGVQRGIFRDGPNAKKGEFQLETSCNGSSIGNNSDGFKYIWYQINGEESWNQNPWVWVVSFKVLSTTGKPIKELNPD